MAKKVTKNVHINVTSNVKGITGKAGAGADKLKGKLDGAKGSAGALLELVDVGVIQTSPSLPLEQRLLELEASLIEWFDKHSPDVIAVERVFSQHNVRTVMGTGQAAGIALLVAARAGIPVVMHTPSEVKAAVTGSGRANKVQVAEMVKRLLSLKEIN